MITINTPSDVIEIVEGLDYSCPEPYQIRSAKATLDSGKGHCLEGTLVAAKLMCDLDFPPLAIILIAEDELNERIAHSVYAYKDTDGFRSIGKSRFSELQSKRNPVDSLDELARSYVSDFKAKGYELKEWILLDLDNSSFEWENSSETVTSLYPPFVHFNEI